MTDTPTRKCTKCGEEKPGTEEFFYASKGVLQAPCKQCRKTGRLARYHGNSDAEKSKQVGYRAENRDKLRDWHKRNYTANKAEILRKQKLYWGRRGWALEIAREYGCSLGRFIQMTSEQDGKCKICSAPKRRLYVDHCHETKNIRGLLCNRCNMVLGVVRDRKETLRNMIVYLETARTNRKWSRGWKHHKPKWLRAIMPIWYAEHGHGCRLCNTGMPIEALVCDHDHATGLFRGMVCRECNRAMGMVHEDKGILMKMDEYLRASSDGNMLLRRERRGMND
jgi:hypothetical protein